ncbi:flocculation protein FLO11-like isoform X2 [Myripristis murdjan]|uniref:Flocculation protein FLO11-like n=1 Tax=Myripristis murdjan TaxID=586833 RepID=A0A667YIN0_9TELE|nr:flocculation protein FLO11-like isoform X2 [Myripristis murdjan]
METKLKTALCALLLINLGCTALGDDPSPAQTNANVTLDVGSPESPESPPQQPPSPSGSEAAESVSDPGPESPAPAPTAASSNHSSSSNNRTGNVISLADETTVASPVPHQNTSSPPDAQDAGNEGNATSKDTPIPPSPFPDKKENLTDQTPAQTLLPTAEHNTSTSQSTTTSPTHTAHIAPTQTPLTTLPSNTTHHPSTHTHTPTNSTSHSSHPTTPPLPKMHSSTSAPAPELRPGTTITSTSTQTSSTTSSSSSSKPPKPTSPRLHPEKSSVAHTSPPRNSSAQTKAQDIIPSKLNVGDDTTVVHQSPALDPLLAGLVSAFIITAVIITLLLFLKLRRRNNRPEFRRLQDLPMDDMMEDTPLSMYSY